MDPPQRRDDKPRGLLVVDPGAGQPLSVANVSLMARAAWTDGGFCVFDQLVEPMTITPAHSHREETQGAYVISGTIGFWVDGDETVAAAGSYVVRPAGSVHSLWNPTSKPGRMLEITSPATRYQKFVLELEALLQAGAPAPGAIAELAAGYGTIFDEAVTRELCSRHGVAVEGGGYGR